MGLIRPYITYIRPLPDGVETPIMVDTLKNMLCYGFKRILHVIYCGVVCCEFTVYLEITHVCFIPRWLHVFAVGPQYQYLNLLFCQQYHLKDTYKVFRKFM